VTLNTLDPKWRGKTAVPIDPAAIGFKAAPAPIKDQCEGCIFMSQRSAVCRQASALAVEHGQIDCDDPWLEGGSVIYVAADKRQLDLLSEAVAGATATASDHKQKHTRNENG
jgi:hypothetical protein